ncbi:MAG: hypothetical protein OXF27_14615 [Acidobacteria bacterium]|nr:hypothetical protein [Acidobacteriota bacterium]
MLLKRIAVALAITAALVAAAPAAPASSAAPAVSVTPVASSLAEMPADDSARAAGSWALVTWGMRERRVGPWTEVFVGFGISVGCGFIGAGVGLVNPIAGIFVGAGCGSGIGA